MSNAKLPQITKQKFQTDDVVLVMDIVPLKMKVIRAVECLAGFRYELAFMKGDGTRDHRFETRWFFESKLIKANHER